MATTMRCTEAAPRESGKGTTCLEAALARQERSRDSYRRVIGTSYEGRAYENLLEATRAVLAAR